jgi:hypothetical protein
LDGLAHFFSGQAETLSVHLLTHLVEATRNLGPLWQTSSVRFQQSQHIIQVSFSILI